MCETNEVNSAPELHPLYAEEYWKLVAFFKDDPTVEVGEINAADHTVTITTTDAVKAFIIERTITTHELVVDVNCTNIKPREEWIDYLCHDNPLYEYMIDGGMYKALLFSMRGTHYFSDNAFSPTGHTAILPQDLAKTLFHCGVNYQTLIGDENEEDGDEW